LEAHATSQIVNAVLNAAAHRGLGICLDSGLGSRGLPWD